MFCLIMYRYSELKPCTYCVSADQSDFTGASRPNYIHSFAVVHVSVAYLLSTRAALRELVILFLYVALDDLVH